MTLDTSVMNVAIATVAKDVGTTVTGIQFAITLYTLVMAAFMITGGKIGQIIGRKRAFMIGCVVYGCGSATTALAKSLPVLIVGWSVLEGLGAALIMPAVVALVATNFGRAERPRAYGLVASAGAVAVAVGPLVGGLFTTYASWRWVFVGEVFMVLGILALTRRMADSPAVPGVRLDPVGTLLSAAGLGAIVYGVIRSGTWGFVQPKPDAPQWLGMSPVVWLLLGGGAVLALFVLWENRRLQRHQGAAARPAHAQAPAPARRADGVLLPVHAAGRALLRDPAVPVGCPGALGRRDRSAPPSPLDHPPAERRRRAEALPTWLAAADRAGRLRPALPRHRRAPGGARRRGRRRTS